MARTTTSRRRRIGVAEAAEHLGVSEKTIRRRIADGDLPAYRTGPKLIKLDIDDVNALERRIPTADGAA